MSAASTRTPIALVSIALASAFVLLPSLGDDPEFTSRIDGTLHHRLDVRVNTFTASSQDAVTLDVDGNGEIAIAWQSRRQQAGTYGVYARRIGRIGDLLSDEIRVNSTTRSHQMAPAIALGPGGALWAAWQSHGQDGSGDGCFARRLDTDGAEFAIAATTVGDQRLPSCDVLANGDVVFGWIGPHDGRDTVHVRRFAPDGTPRSDEVPVIDRGRATTMSLTSLENGFAVTWSAIDDAGRSLGVRLRRHGDHGFEDVVSVDAATALPGIEPTIAANESGAHVVAWLAAGASGYDVFVRRYDADGNELGGAARLGSTADRWLSGAHVATAANGDMLIAWNSESDDGSSFVAARRFDGRTTTWGEPFDAVTADASDGSARLATATGRRAVAIGAEGQIALAWSGDAGCGDASGANLTVLYPKSRFPSVPIQPPATSAETAPILADQEQPSISHVSEASPHDPPVYDKAAADGGRIILPLMTGPDGGFTGIAGRPWTPPDPHHAVGPNHVVQMTNGAIAFFTKATGQRTFQQDIVGGGGFWGNLGATGFVFDPEAIWDPHANRFIAMACERNPASGSGRSYFCFAISDDQDPNGTWHKYRVDVTNRGNIGSGGGDIDSPNIMVDQNVLYLSCDMFRGGQHHLIVTYDKTPLLSGQPIGTNNFLVFNDQNNSYGLPVMHGNSNVTYMIRHFEGNASRVRIVAITNPLTNPTIQGTNVSVPAYGNPVSVPQQGTSGRITTFEARFWSCVWKNGSLWATHHIGQGGRTRQRWYEIQTNNWPNGPQPTVAQSGTIDNGAGVHSFFGSINADASGNAVLCYAQSSTSEFISIARSYRLASDPPGTMRPRLLAQTNPSAYTSSRWGDYSEVVEDPASPGTFWYTHEVATGSRSWATWIGEVRVRDWLAANTSSLSVATGGSVDFEFENSDRAGEGFLLLGTLSGTTPGMTLNPGGIAFPINYDALSGGIMANLNSAAFTNFLNLLDGNGYAQMQLNVPPGVTPLIGRTMDFACATFSPTAWTFASNPVAVNFTP